MARFFTHIIHRFRYLTVVLFVGNIRDVVSSMNKELD